MVGRAVREKGTYWVRRRVVVKKERGTPELIGSPWRIVRGRIAAVFAVRCGGNDAADLWGHMSVSREDKRLTLRARVAEGVSTHAWRWAAQKEMGIGPDWGRRPT